MDLNMSIDYFESTVYIHWEIPDVKNAVFKFTL